MWFLYIFFFLEKANSFSIDETTNERYRNIQSKRFGSLWLTLTKEIAADAVLVLFNGILFGVSSAVSQRSRFTDLTYANRFKQHSFCLHSFVRLERWPTHRRWPVALTFGCVCAARSTLVPPFTLSAFNGRTPALLSLFDHCIDRRCIRVCERLCVWNSCVRACFVFFFVYRPVAFIHSEFQRKGFLSAGFYCCLRHTWMLYATRDE